MKYYKIKCDSNPKVVGSDYPQSWNFTKEYEKRSSNSNAVYALIECFNEYIKPDFIPDLDGFRLSGRAKQTNFISTSVFNALFMDEHVKQVLQTKCNLGEYEFYEATLYVRKEPKQYYILGLFYDTYSLINYPECGYFVENLKKDDDMPPEWHNKQFTCKSDLFDIAMKVPYSIYISFTNIKIKKPLEDLDIYYYVGGGIRIGIVTERFKEAVEEAGLTGLVFEPIEIEVKE